MSEAERVAQSASARFSNSKDRYLVHNVLGLKYRSLGQNSDAQPHLASTVSCLLDVLPYGEFYVAHLARCISIWDECAVSCGLSTSRRDQQIESWYDTCLQTAQLCQRRLSQEANVAQSEISRDLTTIRREVEALLVIDAARGEPTTTAIYELWVSAIATSSNANSMCMPDVWCGELNAVADHLTKSLTPSLVGKRICPLLDTASHALASLPSEDEGSRRCVLQSQQRLQLAKALVQEHQRWRDMLGRKPFSDSTIQNMRPTKNAFLLLHICGTATRDIVIGRDVIKELNNTIRRRDKEIAVCLAFVTDQVRNSFEDENEEIPRGRMSDEGTFRELTSQMHYGGHAICMNGNELHPLNPSMLPITVLLNDRGEIVEIVGGNARENVLRLCAIAKTLYAKNDHQAR